MANQTHGAVPGWSVRREWATTARAKPGVHSLTCSARLVENVEQVTKFFFYVRAIIYGVTHFGAKQFSKTHAQTTPRRLDPAHCQAKLAGQSVDGKAVNELVRQKLAGS